MNRFIQKKLLLLIGVTFSIFLVYSLINSKQTSIIVTETYEAPSKTRLSQYSKSKNQNANDIKKQDSKDIIREPSQVSSEVSFRKKSQEIIQISKTYPEGRDELLRIVSSKDEYKEPGKAPDPHTVDDMRQQQEGALRVLALRVLMEKESSEVFKKDLGTIIKEAKDPTISKIAEAVLKSVEEGRSFFDDLPDAIETL